MDMIRKQDLKSFKTILCISLLLWSFFVIAPLTQAQVVSLGILIFQDESGADVPVEFLSRFSKDLHQKLVLSSSDLSPRIIGTERDVNLYKDMSITQLADLGEQRGFAYVVRCGILALSSERVGQEVKISIGLYAEIISVDSAEVHELRANGSGLQKNISPEIQWDSPDFSSGKFPETAMGQAVYGAMDQLLPSIHSTVVSPVQEEAEEYQIPEGVGEDVSQEDYPPEEEFFYEEPGSNVELQQLIAQAEELLYDAAISQESFDSLSQALEELSEALNSKVLLLEQGEDTSQIDQEIAERTEELEILISTVTEEISDAVLYEGEEQYGYEGMEDREGLLTSIDDILEESLNIIQQINEIRSALQGADEEAQYDETIYYEEEGYEGYEEDYYIEELTDEVSGVVTEDGEPVEGATVTNPDTGESTTTDSSGHYVLVGIPNRGLIDLVLSIKGEEVAQGRVYMEEGYPGVADWELKPRTSSQNVPSLRIIPSAVRAVSAEQGTEDSGTVTGVVRDDEGNPVPRALIRLAGIALARTNSQGEYTFLNVPPGSYQLFIYTGGMKWKSERVRVAAKKGSINKVQYTSQDKVLKPIQTPKLTAVGSAAVLQGVVTDIDRRPIAGAKVTARQSSSAISVRTGSEGSYIFRDLRPGTYRIMVSKAGFDGISRDMTVSASKTTKYDFKLRRASKYIQDILERQRILRGRITDSSTKQPISGATVSMKERKVSSDRNGYYNITNPPVGSFEITVSKSGYVADKSRVEIEEDGTTRKNFALRKTDTSTKVSRSAITPKMTKTIVSVNSGIIKGVVTDTRTGKPIEGALVSITGQKSITTNRSGYYECGKLATGDYQVSVKKTGFTASSRKVTVQAGRTATVNFRLAQK